MFKGYKTIVTNVLVLLFALASMLGTDIGADEQTAIIAGVISIVNIVLRMVTTTPVGKGSE